MLGGMKITFGWGLDGAAWEQSGGGDGGASAGRVATGPAGMLAILRTRFGLAAPDGVRAIRIDAYARALEATPRSWCGESFAVDPWAVASRMLRWRDQLVAAGWDGEAVAGSSPRLRDMAYAEAVFRTSPTFAGTADALKDVADLLRELAADGVPWPTGIESILVTGDPGQLPAPWPEILRNLGALGITVAVEPEPPAVGRLRIVTADTEWAAAEIAARILVTQPGTAVTGEHHTEILDQELARRGLPRIGAVTVSDQRASAQVLPLFLDAVTTPIDVHAVAAFLDLRLPVVDDTDGSIRDVGIIPANVRNKLLDALTREPGIGGDAWNRAIEHLTAPADDAAATTATGTDAPTNINAPSGTDAEVAAALHGFIADHPIVFTDDHCDSSNITEPLLWLGARLRSLMATGPSRALATTAASVELALAILGQRDRVSQGELHRIIDDCADADASPLAGREAGPRRFTASPSLIRTAGQPVLWWAPVDTTRFHRRIWTPGEVAALAAAGIHVPDPETTAAADARARLRGLRLAGDVIAVVPDSVDGARVGVDATLEFAAHECGDSENLKPEELIDDANWSFDGRSLPVSRPVEWVPDAEQVQELARGRRVPAGTHLLPERLSFTQIEKLLAHRLEWLLRYPLRISDGWVRSIPAGNQMIGSFLHKIVETIVQEGTAGDDLDVARRFDELLPRFASELALPGKGRLRQQVRANAMEVISSLFHTLADERIEVLAAEAGFERELPLTLTELNDEGVTVVKHPVLIRGSRDLDARDHLGYPVVIDMKYSGSKSKYRELIENGRSLQLATYAWSVAEEHEIPASSVATAYFELKFGVFDSIDARLGGIKPTTTGAVRGEDLWERAVASIEEALSTIRFGGLVTDEGNRILISAQGGPSALDTNIKNGMASAGAAADAAGRFLPVENAIYTDYGIITGYEADLS